MSLLTGEALAEMPAVPSAKPAYFVSFLEKTILKVPATRDIEVGDLDGDGFADLVFVTADPAVLWVSPGDGKGNFEPPTKIGFSSPYQNAIVGATVLVADSDGDGRDEITTFQERRISSESAEASLFLVTSNLDGTLFKESSAFPFPGFRHGRHPFLFSNDIDGDKKSDFIFGHDVDDFFIMNGKRDKPFPFKRGFKREKKGLDKPLQVIALDADNDGLVDIARIGQREISIVRGETGAIIFDDSAKPDMFFSDLTRLSLGRDFSVRHGRFNQDPFVDLFIYDDAGTGWILLNVEGRNFSTSLPVRLTDYPLVDSGDFNGDGFSDIVAAGGGRTGLKIFLNSGAALFPRTVEQRLGGKTASSLYVFDINNDGLSDIIVTLRGSFGGLEGRVLLNISQRLGN